MSNSKALTTPKGFSKLAGAIRSQNQGMTMAEAEAMTDKVNGKLAYYHRRGWDIVIMKGPRFKALTVKEDK